MKPKHQQLRISEPGLTPAQLQAKIENDKREAALRAQRSPHVGMYDFGLPPLSQAPKRARVINSDRGGNNFAVELVCDGRYLGLHDPRA